MMRHTNRHLRAAHRAHALVFSGILFVALASPVDSAAEPAHEQWATPEIERLFPRPQEGWHAGGVELTATDTLMSNFEAMANSFFPTGNNVSVRLIATRAYTARYGRYEITIDSENIEVAAQIDAIAAAYSSDAALRTRLEDDGIAVVEHVGFDGLSIKAGDQRGHVYKIGSAGIVAIECDYRDCSDDLTNIVNSIDFTSIARFVAFDHRRDRGANLEETWR